MASSTYPYVARTVDPLVVRIDELSLLVGDTNFYAKIKIGSAWTGYMIYASGLGTPIKQKQITDSGNMTLDNGQTVRVEKVKQREVLEQQAKEWLDALEDSFSEQPDNDSIKSAIDRLCWQLHYDITKTSTTVLPTGMSPIVIDKTGVVDGTVKELITNLDTHLTSTDQDTPGAIVKVARNIKGDNDLYTISQALRESGYDSVAKEVHTNGTKMDTTNNKLDTIGSNLSGVTTNLSNIDTNTTAMKADLATTKTSVQTVVTNTNSISGISSNVGTISTNVATSGTKIADLDNKFSNIYLTISTGGGDVNCIRTYESANGW